MTELLDDAALLAALGGALTPSPAEPDAASVDALHRALAARPAATYPVPPVTIVPFHRDRRWARRGGPLHRLRHPAAVAAAVAVLTTSGVAAAVATNHLPGPTRNVAYDLGLPVTSPALAAVQGTMADLRDALAAGDGPRVRTDAARLRSELALLDAADRSAVEPGADLMLARADATGATTAPTAPGRPPATAGGTAPGTSDPSRPTSGARPAGPSGPGTRTGGAEGAEGADPATTPTATPGTTGTGEGGTPGTSGSADPPGSTTSTTAGSGSPTTTTPGRSDDGSGGGSDDGSGTGDHAVSALPPPGRS